VTRDREKYKFKHLFVLNKGLSITKENLKYEGIPCVNYGEIHSRYGFEIIPETDVLKCVDKDFLSHSPKSLLQHGDFVFADTSEDIAGSGNFTYLNSDTNIFAGYHTIVARSRKPQNYRYIAYYFDSINFRSQIQKSVNGVKVYSITQTILKNTTIELPDESVQDQIVRFLDWKVSQINKLINVRKKQIGLLQEKKQQIINKAFNSCNDKWELKPLKFWADSNLRSLGENNSDNFEFDYIDISSIGHGYVKQYPVRHVFSEAPLRARRIVKYGDTIISTVRTYLRSVCFINHDIEHCIVSTGFSVLTPKANYVLPELLSYALSTDRFIDEVVSNSIGVSYPAISDNRLMNLKIALPKDINTQLLIYNELIKQFTILDKTIDNLDWEIKLFTEYRIRLISDVVTGKLDVRDVVVPEFEKVEGVVEEESGECEEMEVDE